DDARHPWLIETIAKRGYRLMLAPDKLTAPNVERPRRAISGRVARWALAASTPCIVVAGVAMALKQRHAAPPSRRTVIVMPFRNGNGDPAQDYLAQGVGSSIEEALWRMQAVNVSSVLAENEVPALLSQLGASDAVTVGGEVTRTADRVLVRAWL